MQFFTSDLAREEHLDENVEEKLFQGIGRRNNLAGKEGWERK